MIGLLASLFVLSLLIFVHELGHFLAAKRAGIKVEEFGFGYPPRLLGVNWGETIYSLNLIPFGGFTRIYGVEEEVKGKNAFWAKPKKTRAFVLLAGILMNFFLGVFAFSLIYSFLGIPQKQGYVEIVAVAEGSPSEEAGMREQDIVRELKTKNEKRKIKTNKEFMKIINQNLGKEIELGLERQGVTLSVVVVPREEPPEEEGPLGIAIADTKMVLPPIYKRPFFSFWFGLREAVGWVGLVFFGVARMVYELGFKGVVPEGITGPVGIVQIATGVARAGIFAFLQFIGALSVNLAVLNLLPIPALDGGRLLFLGVEVVTGKKPRPKLEKWVHVVGMMILLFLMMMVTLRDIQRLLSGGA